MGEYNKDSKTRVQNSKYPMQTSLVFPTYNWPEALEMIFISLKAQSEMPDEVVIADDGSKNETKQLIDRYRDELDIPIKHIWHEDQGWRKTTILNKAVAAASGDYIIQIDGDCILHASFIKDHKEAAAKSTYLYGSRVNIQEELVDEVFSTKRIKFPYFLKGLKRRTRNIHAPFLGKMFGINKDLSRKIRGCNFSFWRPDFIEVNGYDEDMIGWGREDSELAARFINCGIYGKRMRYRGIVYHIWHPTKPREEVPGKDDIQNKTITQGITRCKNGIDKYLHENPV